MVAIESRCGHYGGVDAAVGAVAAWICLLYTLFAPQIFELVWIAAMVPAAFAAGLALSHGSPGLRRMLARGKLDDWVRAAASEKFVSANVTATVQRTGILVYVSVLEHRAFVIADLGIRTRVPEDAWASAVCAIEQSLVGVSLEAGFDTLARATEAAATLLEQYVPRRDDDSNELPDLEDNS